MQLTIDETDSDVIDGDANLAFAADDVITVGYEFDATDNYATDFDALGGASIVLDDGDNAVTIDETDSDVIDADANLAFAADDVITVGYEFAATDNYATDFDALGGASIVLDDGDNAVTIDETDSDAIDGDANLAFAADDVITVGYEFDATDNYATDFDALGGASIVLDDGDNAVTIDETDSDAIDGDANLAFAANDVITVGYEFDATDNYATDFDALGGASIVLDDDDDAVTIDETDSDVIDGDANLAFAADDVITVGYEFDSTDNYATDFDALGGASIVLDDTSNTVSIDKTDALAIIASATLGFAAGDALTIVDAFAAADDLEDFTSANLGATSRTLDDSDNAVTIDETDSDAIDGDANLAFAANDVITVGYEFDATDDYATDFDALGGASIVLDDDDNAATIDKTDALAIIASATLGFAAGDALTIVDAFAAADDLEDFTSANLGATSRTLDDSDNAVTIDETDSDAIDGDANLAFAANDVITVGYEFDATDNYATDFDALGGASIVLDDGDNAVTIDETDSDVIDGDANLAFAADDVITVGYEFDATDNYATDFDALGGASIVLDDGSNAVTIDEVDSDAIDANANLAFAADDVITVGYEFAATDNYATDFDALGGASIVLDDDDDAVTIDETDSDVIDGDANLAFAADDVITVGYEFDATDDYATDFDALGGASIVLDDGDNAVTIDEADSDAIDANANLAFAANDVITVGYEFDATDDYATDFDALGGASIVLDDGDNAVTIDEVDSDAIDGDANLAFAANDVITVGYEFDSTDNYATDFDALGGASIVLDDGSNAVTIDKTDALAIIASATLGFAAGDALTIVDAFAAADDLEDFTSANLGATSRTLNDPDNAVTIDETDSDAIDGDANLAFAANDVITVGYEFDATDNYATDFDALGGASIVLDDDDNAATIDKTDALAIIASATLGFAAGDALTIVDAFAAADDLEDFTSANLGATSRTLDDSDNAVTIDETDSDAIDGDANLAFAANDVITVGYEFDATDNYATDFDALGGASIVLDDGDNAVTIDETDSDVIDADANLAFAANDVITVGYEFDATDNYATDFDALGGASIVLDDGDNAVTIDETDSDVIDGDANLAFAADDVITVGYEFDATDNYATDFDALGGASIVLDDGDNAVTIDETDSDAIDGDANLAFAANDVITVGYEFDATDNYATDFDQLGGASIVLDDGNNAVTIDETDSDAIDADANLAFAANDVITVGYEFDSTDNYATDFDALGGASIVLDDGDNAATIDKTDALAIIASATLGFAAGDALTIVDAFAAADDLEDFTSANLGATSRTLDDSDNAVTIDETDSDAIDGDANLAFAANDVITVGYEFDATDNYATDFDALGGASIVLDDGDNAVTIDEVDSDAIDGDANLAFATNDVITVGYEFDATDNYAADFDALGGASIVLDDADNALTIDETDSDVIDGDANLAFAADDVITVGYEFDATDNYATDFDALGGASIVLDDGDNAVTIDETDSDVIDGDANLAFAANDVITVGYEFDATDNYATDFDALGGASIVLDDGDNAVTIDETDSDAIDGDANLAFAANDVITVGYEFDATDNYATDFDALGGASIVLDDGDNAVTIDETDSDVIDGDANLAFAANDVITVGYEFDATDNYATDFDALGGASIVLDDGNNAVTIDEVDSDAIDANANLAFAADDVITVGYEFAATDNYATDFDALGGASIVLDDDDDAVTIDETDSDVIDGDANLAFAADDVITVGYEFDATDDYATDFDALGGASIVLDDGDNAVTIDETDSDAIDGDANLAFAANDVITVGYEFDATDNYATDFDALGGASIVLDDGNNAVTIDETDSDAIDGDANLAFAANDVITVGYEFDSTDNYATDFDALGGASIVLDDGE